MLGESFDIIYAVDNQETNELIDTKDTCIDANYEPVKRDIEAKDVIIGGLALYGAAVLGKRLYKKAKAYRDAYKIVQATQQMAYDQMEDEDFEEEAKSEQKGNSTKNNK